MSYVHETWADARSAAREFTDFDTPAHASFDDYATAVAIEYTRAHHDNGWRVIVKITVGTRVDDFEIKNDGTFTRERRA